MIKAGDLFLKHVEAYCIRRHMEEWRDALEKRQKLLRLFIFKLMNERR